MPDSTNFFTLEMIKTIDEIAFFDDIERATKQIAKLKKQKGFQGSISQLFETVPDEKAKQSILKLALVRFSALQEDDCVWIFKNHLVESMGFSEIDFADKIGKKIGTIELEEEKYAFMANATKAMRENSQALGSGTLQIDGKAYPPTVKAWLDDYLSFPSNTSYKGNMEELTYINTSANTKRLTQEERQLLLSLLKIYDVLNSRAGKYYATPEAVTEVEAFQNFDLYKSLPGLTFLDAPVEPQKTALNPRSLQDVSNTRKSSIPENARPGATGRNQPRQPIDIEKKLKDLSRRTRI